MGSVARNAQRPAPSARLTRPAPPASSMARSSLRRTAASSRTLSAGTRTRQSYTLSSQPGSASPTHPTRQTMTGTATTSPRLTTRHSSPRFSICTHSTRTSRCFSRRRAVSTSWGAACVDADAFPNSALLFRRRQLYPSARAHGVAGHRRAPEGAADDWRNCHRQSGLLQRHSHVREHHGPGDRRHPVRPCSHSELLCRVLQAERLRRHPPAPLLQLAAVQAGRAGRHLLRRPRFQRK